MCFLLYSFELSKEEDRSVFDGMLSAFFMVFGLFFSDEVCEDGVIDGESIDGIELLDKFETHGAAYSAIPV